MSSSIRRAIRWSLRLGWREPRPAVHLRTHPLADAPAAHSIIFGISQSGRLIQTMLLHGLHVDEAGVQV